MWLRMQAFTMHGMPNVLSMHHASYDCIYLLQKLPGLQLTEKVPVFVKTYFHPFSKIL